MHGSALLFVAIAITIAIINAFVGGELSGGFLLTVSWPVLSFPSFGAISVISTLKDRKTWSGRI